MSLSDWGIIAAPVKLPGIGSDGEAAGNGINATFDPHPQLTAVAKGGTHTEEGQGARDRGRARDAGKIIGAAGMIPGAGSSKPYVPRAGANRGFTEKRQTNCDRCGIRDLDSPGEDIWDRDIRNIKGD